MGRHGYTKESCGDNWQLIKWRGMVASAVRGKRGQAMLRSLLTALDAMPLKQLVAGDLITEDGECCTIGALLIERETPNARNMHECNEVIAEELDVAECLVQEIEWENDECGPHLGESPMARWARMRAWIDKQIVKGEA